MGYLRGTIDNNGIWTGSYYLAGIESRRGSFALTLSPSGDSYSGIYTDTNHFNASATGARLSLSTPEDLLCFRTSEEYLERTEFTDLTGTYYDNSKDTTPGYMSYLLDTYTIEQSYTYYAADGSLVSGIARGRIFMNGQVVCAQFYEPDYVEGLDLMVVQNATSYFALNWKSTTVSNFNYADNAGFTHYNLLDTSVPLSTARAKAQDTVCYALWTIHSESSCLATYPASSNDDDELSGSADAAIKVAAAFSIGTFVLVAGLICFLCLRVQGFRGASSGKENLL